MHFFKGNSQTTTPPTFIKSHFQSLNFISEAGDPVDALWVHASCFYLVNTLPNHEGQGTRVGVQQRGEIYAEHTTKLLQVGKAVIGNSLWALRMCNEATIWKQKCVL